MGNMMYLVDGFAVAIYMILIYLLSRLIIEKNASAISMTKILGYTDGEIGQLYLLPTSLIVVICLLSSFPIDYYFIRILFRTIMMSSMTGWISFYVAPEIYVKMFLLGAGTYVLVAAKEFQKIKKIPMEQALKTLYKTNNTLLDFL